MSTKTVFWLRYSVLVLTLGTGVGMLGYQNLKPSPFETLLDNLQAEENLKLSFVQSKK